jgi:hypothetical protein
MKESDDSLLKPYAKQTRLRRRANVREILDVLKQQGGFDGLFINLPHLVI